MAHPYAHKRQDRAGHARVGHLLKGYDVGGVAGMDQSAAPAVTPPNPSTPYGPAPASGGALGPQMSGVTSPQGANPFAGLQGALSPVTDRLRPLQNAFSPIANQLSPLTSRLSALRNMTPYGGFPSRRMFRRGGKTKK